jgi:hypothetical protein
MPNTFLTASAIAEVAARLGGKDLNLGALISRDVEADFNPGSGNVVKVRVPGAVAAQTRSIYDTSTPLVSDEIAEQSIPVTLSDHIYDNVVLADGSLDLDIEDFARQVLVPQSTAIVKQVERSIAAALSATPESASITYSAATPAKTFTALRKQLRDNGVSTEAPIVAVVGSSVYADLLDGPEGTFDPSGKVRGIEVIESTRVAADEIVAFVKEAFTLVVRAPQVPEGAPYGASVKAGDFAVRHIRSYDSTVAADRSLVSAFVAVQAMPIAIDNEDGTVSLVAHGGAVRVLTAA